MDSWLYKQVTEGERSYEKEMSPRAQKTTPKRSVGHQVKYSLNRECSPSFHRRPG